MSTNSALGGRAVLRLRRRATSLRFTRRFLMVTRRRPRRWASPLSSRRSRSRCCSPPGRRRRPPHVPAFPVTIDKVAIAAKPVRIVSLSPTATEDLFAIGAGKQVIAVDDQSNYPARGSEDEALRLHAERRGDRRLQTGSRRRLARQQRPAEGAGEARHPGPARAAGGEPRRGVRADPGPRQGDGPRRRCGGDRRGAETEDRRDRGGGAEVLEAQLLRGAQPGLLLGDVVDVRRPGAQAARPAATSPTRRRRAAPATRSSPASTSCRRTRT